MAPLAGAQNAGVYRRAQRCGQVSAEVNQLGGDAARRRLARVGIVVRERDRAGDAGGRRDLYPQLVIACQPAVEGQPVGPEIKTGHRAELAGQPVHVGGVAGTAGVAGAEPDKLPLPPPDLAHAGQARRPAPAGSRQRRQCTDAASRQGERARACRAREKPPPRHPARQQIAAAAATRVIMVAGCHCPAPRHELAGHPPTVPALTAPSTAPVRCKPCLLAWCRSPCPLRAGFSHPQPNETRTLAEIPRCQAYHLPAASRPTVPRQMPRPQRPGRSRPGRTWRQMACSQAGHRRRRQ